MFQISEAWAKAYPGAVVGALALSGVANPEDDEALNRRKAELEAAFRARWAGAPDGRAALAALPTIQAYSAYYARFRKTYHVLLQLESVALKGKPIPRVAALVEAMFMAELENQLLTAGHDVSALELPVTVDVARGDQRYVTLSGKDQALAPGDMYIRDGAGPISSIIYGPDRRTPIRPTTTSVLFTVYAPPGIGWSLVSSHLDDMRANVLLVSPAASVELCLVHEAVG